MFQKSLSQKVLYHLGCIKHYKTLSIMGYLPYYQPVQDLFHQHSINRISHVWVLQEKTTLKRYESPYRLLKWRWCALQGLRVIRFPESSLRHTLTAWVPEIGLLKETNLCQLSLAQEFIHPPKNDVWLWKNTHISQRPSMTLRILDPLRNSHLTPPKPFEHVTNRLSLIL